jgi:hypothetical protein
MNVINGIYETNNIIILGKFLVDEGKKVVAALRNTYIVLWKQGLLANGTLPSGTNVEELVQIVRKKLYDLHKAERQQRTPQHGDGREEQKNGDEDDDVSEVMENDWYPKFWVSFLFLGPPFSVQHEVEVCSVLTRY